MKKSKFWKSSSIVILLNLLVLVLGGCILEKTKNKPEKTEHQIRLESHYNLMRPDGKGPFPAVMFVPGCLGFWSYNYSKGEEFRKKGYVVIFVEYMKARGTGFCYDVPMDMVVQDILTSILYLKSLSYVKKTEISVIGWSNGGGAVIDTLVKVNTKSQSPLYKAVAFYPWPECSFVKPWKIKTPVLLLMGALDRIVDSKKCKNIVKELSPEISVELHEYPDAHHGFDNEDLPLVEKPSAISGYNPKAGKSAWEKVYKFLKR